METKTIGWSSVPCHITTSLNYCTLPALKGLRPCCLFPVLVLTPVQFPMASPWNAMIHMTHVSLSKMACWWARYLKNVPTGPRMLYGIVSGDNTRNCRGYMWYVHIVYKVRCSVLPAWALFPQMSTTSDTRLCTWSSGSGWPSFIKG